ncbi:MULTISPECIES: NAD(P)H-dependent glycerol-3-phosphate dehydrogenase [Phyllobacteriaceae]|jgi:glycerol-3-phosphate dehydrogenase (NAD(P)+)|uniref:Glycerol-3-phosphate dehydrogenase [NAD(P)+] n=1 Tax=Mesorhizobium hungaricum TaxID=1566387 RepID=A0A1C2DER7_9HYPH|nr:MULTISPECIES: NAD(P)H-dependent glycerol-3-phosphate dehydrogenase [Mesorhizobium]MBN9232619.1 NAD(P)-dependent glycerol-3-phosphate dehydrogenase [Mesorhizobium sp.]MDQ0330216.1 glycerol-3-phosphate dehydrogenase (NAD(P)+) [Mesorhizobium sp. YL-MeA3-2017]OCX13262.1 glycerol-3-phosphate dehydrogenase [Mesorhizobium hungaricum]
MSEALPGGRRIAVLGGGAWGTALAQAMLRACHSVTLWARDAEMADAIRKRANPRYLPGIVLDAGIEATSSLAEALKGADCVLAVTPAQSLRQVLNEAKPYLAPAIPVVLCAKGIERNSGALLSTIAGEILPGTPIAALSGPSFATDVAKGLPTAVVVAAREESLAAELAALFSARNLRCYSSDDLVGVEIGGALKNVFALAAGAVAGAGLGASAQAAMVTRGFVELRRIGAAFGAKPETLMGLSGLGDLMLTCSSAQSRNFAYGLALGRGEALAGRPLAEGVPTAAIAARLAAEQGIDAPIISAVAAILEGAITIGEAVSMLMTRPLKTEND